MNIIEAIDDKNLLGSAIRDPDSWRPWRALLGAAFGLPLDQDQLDLYRACTGRRVPPSEAAAYLWMVIGRRGGKSFAMAVTACYLACFRNWKKYLSPGERAVVLLVAADREQAKILHKYIFGILSTPILSSMIETWTADTIELRGGVSVQVVTRSYRTVRGRSVCVAVLDELAFWRDDDSANPDTAVLNAVRASMATFGSDAMVIAASSPYAKRGVLWDAHKKYYGKDDAKNLVWVAATRIMNPTVPQAFIDDELERDPASASSEYFAEFRSDIAAFVDLAVLEACTADGLFELPPISGTNYVAFVDPSGGSSDSMTLAIAHREDDGVAGVGGAVLDCIREVRAPFQPENVVNDFCQTLTSYGIGVVTGDRYAGEWPREQFSKRNITYRPSEKVKSDIYRDMLPILNSRRCQLLDNPRLISQFHGLERRTARGGKDSIDHGPGAHDDLANSVAGAIVLAAHNVRKMNFHAPVSVGRTEVMADFVAGLFDPGGGGDSSMPPGGWPFGDPRSGGFSN
jgi:Terminase large subunit, T4likevirus-type, N-terminal